MILERTVSHPNAIYGVAISADGNRLATASLDNTAAIWELATGKRLLTLKGHGDGVAYVQFFPEGRRIVTASLDRSLRIWNHDGGLIATFSGHQDYLTCADLHPTGAWLASGGFDNTVRLWEVESASAAATLSGHEDTVQCLAFAPRGPCLASGSDDGSIRIWDHTKRKQWRVLTGHVGAVEGLAFSPSEPLLASVGADGTLRFWKTSPDYAADSADDWALIATLDSNVDRLKCLAFAPAGDWLFTGGTAGSLQTWRVDSRKMVAEARPHRNTIYDIAVAADGKRLATASFDRDAHLWSWQ